MGFLFWRWGYLEHLKRLFSDLKEMNFCAAILRAFLSIDNVWHTLYNWFCHQSKYQSPSKEFWILQNHVLFSFFIKKKKKTSIHLSSPILKCIFHVLKIKVNFYEYVNWTCQITFERKLGCLLECSQIFIYKLNAN